MKRLHRRVLAGAGIAAVALLAAAAPAIAQDAEPTVKDVSDGLTLLGTQINLLWVVIGAVLVIFMRTTTSARHSVEGSRSGGSVA